MKLLAQVEGGDAWEPVELSVEGLEYAAIGFERGVDYGYVSHDIGIVFQGKCVRLNLEHYSEDIGQPNQLGDDSSSRYVKGATLKIASPYIPN